MTAEHTPSPRTHRRTVRLVAVAALATPFAVATPSTANAALVYPSDVNKPDLVSLLSGYNAYWKSDGPNDLHGTVVNASVLDQDDALAVWINQHATSSEKFLALQDSEYENLRSDQQL